MLPGEPDPPYDSPRVIALTCRLFGQHLPVFGTWLYRSLRATIPSQSCPPADRQVRATGLEMFAVTNAIPMDVIIGVDTHKDVHAAAAISGAGVYLATITIPARATRESR